MEEICLPDIFINMMTVVVHDHFPTTGKGDITLQIKSPFVDAYQNVRNRPSYECDLIVYIFSIHNNCGKGP